MLEELKEKVFHANLELVALKLVSLTWGNASGIDRDRGYVVIKPSGISYADMTVDDMVVVDMHGRNVQGTLRPSSDTLTHLALYRAWPEIGGIVHTHSPAATSFAQACREIPCMGTTHADSFHGSIRVAPALTPEQVEEGYEKSTGDSIVDAMEGIHPLQLPGILAAHHAPFTWGKGTADAVQNALILELIARMAMDTLLLNPAVGAIPLHISEKHFMRKHGPEAYYGQRKS